jgi:exodeoxyribonuclease V gamma subunit
MALHLHKSNRTERLVDALAKTVAQPMPHASVFAPEWIVVSSPGMERWLSMELAKRLGVWANPAFPFPRKLVDSILSALCPEPNEHARGYEPTSMTFAIARLLREHADDPLFRHVRRYYADDSRGRRRLALAQRLAELFDQYLTYRPEMVLEWESSVADDFQPALFRGLSQLHGPQHLAARTREALRSLANATKATTLLPARMHVFGVSSLPPIYVDLLSALGTQRDVHLYALSPTREYYGDIRPKKKRGRRGQLRQQSFELDDFHAEPHALLGSLGKHGREFFDLLEERKLYQEGREDLYQEPPEDTLLHVLQADLLALRTRGDEPDDSPRVTLESADTSISIHACHGPMREVEVLHDQLMQLISEHGVEPHEIVVMTPNISEYAPRIDAVFSQPKEQRPQIPFRIADRAPSETEPLLLAIDALLDVLLGRFGANQVLDLLGIDLIREHFEIAPEQLETLRDWVEQSGIRWAVDAAHRAELDQPAFAENTWRFGLARLALGYSGGAPVEQLFAGVAPAAIDTGDGALLGHFLEFCARLFSLRELFKHAATPTEWERRVTQLIALMLGDTASAPEHKQLHRALCELVEHAARAGFEEAFDLATLRSLLQTALSAKAPAHGFMSYGVTFCQLIPMRSIPFKVLCLLGLNDGAFPANDTPFVFDEIKKNRRLGDRSRRDDDRQLFLEALLCARETLIITYIGQSLKNGKALPPSVVVSELIAHAAESCKLAGRDDAKSPVERTNRMEARLVVRHALSAASPRNFGADPDARLFSFSLTGWKAALALADEHRRPQPFAVLRAPLHEPPAEIALSDLERCLMNASREFCQRRLALYLGDDIDQLQEREPFALNLLERWKLGNDALERPDSAASSLIVQRAQGLLPFGHVGAREHQRVQQHVQAIAAAMSEHTVGERLPRVEIDLLIDGVRLTGSVDDLWRSAHVRAQYSKLGSRHELRQYIRHIALRCMALDAPKLGLPTRSVLIGRSDKVLGQVWFEAEGHAPAILRELMALYTDALSRPLPLIADVSRAYVEAIGKNKAEPDALLIARNKFAGGSGQDSEPTDPYVLQLYPDFDAVLNVRPGEFERSATRLYEPFFRSRKAP